MILLLRLGFFIFLVALWWCLSRMVGGLIVPDPFETLDAAKAMAESGELGRALAQTLTVYLSGFAAAAIAGIAAGMLLGIAPRFGRTTEPYLHALASTPRVAFIPLIIVTLGIGVTAKATVVFLGAVMPIFFSTYSGMESRDEELIEMARANGASPAMIFREVLFPGAVPFIITGLRIGAAIGLINSVVAELYTAINGLGGLLAIYGNSFRMAHYFVVVLVLAALGATVSRILKMIENRLESWRPVEMRTGGL